MFKAMILLKRTPQASAEEFQSWWLERHAPMARQLPGLRKAVFNVVTDGDDYDGVSELWFDSKEAFEAAYASETGQAVASDSLSQVSSRVRLLVTENTIVG